MHRCGSIRADLSHQARGAATAAAAEAAREVRQREAEIERARMATSRAAAAAEVAAKQAATRRVRFLIEGGPEEEEKKGPARAHGAQ